MSAPTAEESRVLLEPLSGYMPGPWLTDGEYSHEERGVAIIAARTDCGPLPGNPTRGMVAFATELLEREASRCEASARLIAAAPDLATHLRAALDREAALTAEIERQRLLVQVMDRCAEEAEAERDAARAEAIALMQTIMQQALTLPEDTSGKRELLRLVAKKRAALAQEPGA